MHFFCTFGELSIQKLAKSAFFRHIWRVILFSIVNCQFAIFNLLLAFFHNGVDNCHGNNVYDVVDRTFKVDEVNRFV